MLVLRWTKEDDMLPRAAATLLEREFSCRENGGMGGQGPGRRPRTPS
jgi:hypothetical protein